MFPQITTERPLAAACAFGIARNHPFTDGNKRTAAVIMETFLVLNGHTLGASDAELVVAVLADWVRRHFSGS